MSLPVLKKASAAAGSDLGTLEARIQDLERRLDRLRALYESFFLGVERSPPNVPRRELNRLIVEMQQSPISNASMRFRFQSLMQRWVLHTTYWNRTLREIESGTYRRDLARAQRHLSERGALTEEQAIALGIPAGRVKAFVARQTRNLELRAARPEATRPPAPSPAIPGVEPGAIEDAYRSYVEARQKLGAADGLPSLERMREKLRDQIPRILAERGCARVHLEVVVDGDKVRLRARPGS